MQTIVKQDEMKTAEVKKKQEAERAEARDCYHCGESLARGPVYREQSREGENASEDPKSFCCQGCLTAYEIISGSGNESYYRHRETYGARPRQTPEDVYRLRDTKIEADENGIKNAVFLVEGIHCASCVWLNEKVLGEVEGVLQAEVRLATGRAYLSWDTKRVDLVKLAGAAGKVGYRLIPIDESGETGYRDSSRKLLKEMTVAGFFAGNNMLVAAALYAGYFEGMEIAVKNFLHLVGFGLALPVFFYSARSFFRNALGAFRARVLTMDVPVAIGISLAFFYSVYAAFSERGEVYFDSICFIVFILLIGRFIESRLRLRGMTYLENLRQSTPDTARVIREGEPTLLAAEEIKPGDCLLIESGERTLADGVLLSPLAEVDESILTGEYRPVTKKRGETVLAGARVAGEAIRLRVLSEPGGGTIGEIRRLIEDSLKDESAVGRLAALAGRWFIAFVLLTAGATFMYRLSGGLEEAVLATVSLLIVACPCALSLAIPTAFSIAIQRAFAGGVLIKKSESLLHLSEVKNIGLDKTGTLSQGRLSLRDVYISGRLGGVHKEAALGLATRLQKMSGVRHPVASAFIRAVGENVEEVTGLGEPETEFKVDEVTYIPGRGIRAVGEEYTYYLGSGAWMESLGVSLAKEYEENFPLAANAETGLIPVYLLEERQTQDAGSIRILRGIFTLADAPRPEASRTIQDLKKIARVFLLSGDNLNNVKSFANSMGIEEYYGEVSPANKSELVGEKEKTGATCMVGDGINDTGALARARCGVSFADAQELSLNSADVLLLGNDLGRLEFLFRLARANRRVLRTNLALAFAYNLALIPLAMGGYIIPLAGAVFMSLSSITVLLCSLTLFRVPLSRPGVVTEPEK